MKTLIATLLATAAGTCFAQAPTAALNHDPSTYRNATEQTTAAYKAAVAKCDAKSANDKDICMAEAKVARVRGENQALAKYITSPQSRQKAGTNVADAEYALAKEKCDDKEGADKDSCLDNAKSVHTAAVADAKAASTSTGASGAGATAAGGGLVTTTASSDGAKAAAVDKCAQMGADAKTGCLVETKPSPVRESAAAATAVAADKTREAAAVATEKTREAAAVAADKTKDVAAVAVDKTKAAAAVAADKTKDVAAVAAEKTRDAAAVASDKTRVVASNAAAKGRVVAADTAITAKVKAGLVGVKDLESLGIHVETEKGIVMLSGFVNSKDEADKAVSVAKGVQGVASVKSAIQVK
jgi:hyperosmotically inducible protein